MEAPDKIYLHGYDFDKEPCVKWHEKPMEKGMRGYHVVNVEYIRKDFLLEWLEAKVYEHNEDKFDDGFNTALGQVIDKINTL